MASVNWSPTRAHTCSNERHGILAVAITLCLLLSAIQPRISLAEDPLDNEPVGGVELELAWQMGGAITALDVQGDYAYLGIGPRLVIVDVSDPTQPVEVGRTDVLPSVETGKPEPYSQICAVSVVTDTAYLAVVSVEKNLSLLLVDVSDPTTPQPGAGVTRSPSGFPDPDSVELCWFGDELVVGCTTDDGYPWEDQIHLSLVQLADDRPTWKGCFGPVWSAGSYGRLLDLSSDHGRLRVLREWYGDCTWDSYSAPIVASDDWSGTEPVSTPSASRNLAPLFSKLYYDAWALATETSDYIVSYERLYSVEPEPTVAPAAYPSCQLSESATHDACLTPDNRYAAVVSETELMLVDLDLSTHPNVVSRVAAGGDCVAASGSYVFVAAADGLRVFDISDPHQPQLEGRWHYPNFGTASHLETISPQRMLASVGSQLLALDTPADADPIIVGSLDVGAPINDFCLVSDQQCDLVLATNGLGLIPVSLDDEGLPRIDNNEPMDHCEANYVSVVEAEWQTENWDGSTRTERRVLAMANDHSLAVISGAYSQECPAVRVAVCDGFDLDQMVGRYAYVGRAVYGDGCNPESGQIEIWDLSSWGAPRVASIVATDRPVGSIIPHSGYLFVDGENDWGAPGAVANSLFRVFDLSDPLAPEQMSATIFGQCESSDLESVSDAYLVATTTGRACCNSFDAGDYRESSITIMRVNDGPELQLVNDTPCVRSTTILSARDELLIGAHSTLGLFAWRIRPLAAFGVFYEGEDCHALTWYEGLTPEIPQTFGTDRHASSCGFVAGQVGWDSELPRREDYFLWARVRENDPVEDTFALSAWQGVDSMRSPSVITFDALTLGATWEWRRIAKLDDPCGSWTEARSVDAGIAMNHPSAAIDCLYLTDSPDAVPPEITPCVPVGLVVLPMITR